MVDFKKLKSQKKNTTSFDPIEIFRRLPKPEGINDLYASQAEVLKEWYPRRKERDIVLKLHTGGGKTLVGLLMAQSILLETNQPVLYLAPTKQLVQQTLEKAASLKIPATQYQTGFGVPLPEEFVNSRAIMIGTYRSLFNGKSRFKIQGAGPSQDVGGIILDDAHVAFTNIRETFTLEVNKRDNEELYLSLAGSFRETFINQGKVGTFDDVLAGREYATLEIPYWSWMENLDLVRGQLQSELDLFSFQWPLLRDELHLCHALLDQSRFTITPVLPLINYFPTFVECDRRIYMSATISDDSDIVRTFDASPDLLDNPLSSKSLAGVSERMVLIPNLMPFNPDSRQTAEEMVKSTAKKSLGSVILVNSDAEAEEWEDEDIVAVKGSVNVDSYVSKLQAKTFFGPAVFANRYDGIDLPGDSCRLLVLSGLPIGTSSYELFRASSFSRGESLSRMLAQRIEQGIGRGARGSGDHCVIILSGSELAAWVAKNKNFELLTKATRAQIDMGVEISKEISNHDEIIETAERSYNRDSDWVTYHAETLAQRMAEPESSDSKLSLVAAERKAFNSWQDGRNDKALAHLDKFFASDTDGYDRQSLGWIKQLAARIAHANGNIKQANIYQGDAYSLNRNLLRPTKKPSYSPLPTPSDQAVVISKNFGDYRQRQAVVQKFSSIVSHLHNKATSNQFEQALEDMARFLGFTGERFDNNGEGPDVLWLLPNKQALIIEAKSRKSGNKPLTKDEHGQLLVADEWCHKHYPEYELIRVSAHANKFATKAASASESFAFTPLNQQRLIRDAKILLGELASSQIPEDNLPEKCSELLQSQSFLASSFVSNYLELFEDETR